MKWLDKPYPMIVDPKIALAVSFGIGIVCFIILSIFEPFGISGIKVDKSFFLFRFGLNGTIALLIFYFIIPKIFPSFFLESRWTVKKHVILYMLVITLITLFNFILNSTAGADFSPQHGLLKFFYITGTVGAFPVLLITYITEKLAREKNEGQAKLLNNQKDNIEKRTHEDQEIIITSESNKQETISFLIDKFLYAQSQSNYTQIHIRKNDGIESKMIRSSLKNIEAQIDSKDQVIRCHKSYLINKSNIQSIEGNARSLYIKIKEVEAQIPVSRSLDRDLLV